jgi:hypothetical protein
MLLNLLANSFFEVLFFPWLTYIIFCISSPFASARDCPQSGLHSNWLFSWFFFINNPPKTSILSFSRSLRHSRSFLCEVTVRLQWGYSAVPGFALSFLSLCKVWTHFYSSTTPLPCPLFSDQNIFYASPYCFLYFFRYYPAIESHILKPLSIRYIDNIICPIVSLLLKLEEEL